MISDSPENSAFVAPEPKCPDWLLARAGGNPPLRTIIAGANSASAIDGARIATKAGLIEPVLVGERQNIRQLAEAHDWDIAGFDLVEADDDRSIAEASAKLAADPGTGAIMKGHVHTDALMATLLNKDAGIRTERRMTHAFLMTGSSFNPFILADAALNILPDIKTKQAIVENSVELSRAMGVNRPHVALLSATESVLAHMPSSTEAAELTKWAGRAVPDAEVFGPLALDNIISLEAARAKGIDHPVAGRADVIVVPNIECGNALFKAMVHYMGACGAGLVLGGRIPVMLTSRSDPPAARLASAALAVLAGNNDDFS